MIYILLHAFGLLQQILSRQVCLIINIFILYLEIRESNLLMTLTVVVIHFVFHFSYEEFHSCMKRIASC